MSLITDLTAFNTKRWEAAKLTRRAEYQTPVSRILAAQNRYELIQRQTGVHWTFVACTHYRESNLNFATQLGQGDPLSRVSIHVPAGRGPFQTFEEGAYDALVNCQPYAARNDLWKHPAIMPAMLTLLEMYNGLGYAKRGLPSPYLWSGTDQYVSGKYVADGVFDPNVVDKQLGVSGILVCLSEASPSIFTSQATSTASTPAKPTSATPSAPQGPIINRQGEDITLHLSEFYQILYSVIDWLRHGRH